ncbi:peptidoglycan DD-metalloendopeptidase family protein [Galactobacter sp.]|uniref:murein hydrolase activator EnvC family protein n=1 Tax=Galactobacter sp. TaxID=2676125 RepID=UPI0025C019F6|nr:peptidoglycan DD-metalloendopeptidase family protein [Galactobacter sp.]
MSSKSVMSRSTQPTRRAASRKPAKLARAVLGSLLVGAFTFGAGVVPAQADKLDDKKAQIDKQVKGTQEDLEGLHAEVQTTADQLKSYQDKVPAAKQRVSDAEAKVAAAQRELTALQNRLTAAKKDQADLEAKRERNAAARAENEQAAGQIASQAYRQGGQSNNNLSMLFSGADPSDMATSMEMANRAAESRNKKIANLRSADATNRNNEARLKTIAAEIEDLKEQADAALSRTQAARSEAQQAKATLDSLVSKTSATQKRLKGEVASAKGRLDKQRSEQRSIDAQIKERQERLKREAEERARKARAEAKKKAAAAEKARQARAANAAKLQRQAAAAQTRANTATSNATPSGSVQKSSWGLIVPSTGGYISSGFGWRPTPAGTIDYLGTGGYVHGGQDWGYGGQCGAPIKAAAAGTVREAGSKSTHGIVVSLDHAVVKGHALTTNYHHMSRVAVSVGQKVQQGQTIGYVGTTGNSTGCHLHFETIVDGSYRNPLGLLP